VGKTYKPYKERRNNETKMKAYVPDDEEGFGKYKPDKSKFGKMTTKQDKLIAKNANRSLKKAVRQQAKKELKEYKD
jgi:hypothetical protein